MDKSKIDRFWKHRTQIDDSRIATNYRDDGRIEFDVALVCEHMNDHDYILDLGAGTCTLAIRLLDKASRVVAVEKFHEFLERAPNHPNLLKITSNILDFDSDELFNIILIFGVINFITSDEEDQLYSKCYRLLAPGGRLIVKNQCGLEKEIVVDTYSSELGAHYHARYPHVSAQLKRLADQFDVSQHDIYPSRINRWSNTHFFAFVATKS